MQLSLFDGAPPPRRGALSIDDLNVEQVVTYFRRYFPNAKPNSKGKYDVNCIFHEERTPSLRIWPEYNSYLCHGCGQRGGPFDLLNALTYTPEDFLRNEFPWEQDAIANIQEKVW